MSGQESGRPVAFAPCLGRHESFQSHETQSPQKRQKGLRMGAGMGISPPSETDRRISRIRPSAPFPNGADSAAPKCYWNQGRLGRLLHPSTCVVLPSSSSRRCPPGPRPPRWSRTRCRRVSAKATAKRTNVVVVVPAAHDKPRMRAGAGGTMTRISRVRATWSRCGGCRVSAGAHVRGPRQPGCGFAAGRGLLGYPAGFRARPSGSSCGVDGRPGHPCLVLGARAAEP